MDWLKSLLSYHLTIQSYVVFLFCPIGMFYYLFKETPKVAVGVLLAFCLLLFSLKFGLLYWTFPHSNFPPYPKHFKMIMDKAVEYEAEHDKWPESISEDLRSVDSLTQNIFFSYSCYTEKDSIGEDLFVIKATTKTFYEKADIPAGYYVTCNNLVEKTYNHKNFLSNGKGYLMDATYVGDGTE